MISRVQLQTEQIHTEMGNGLLKTPKCSSRSRNSRRAATRVIFGSPDLAEFSTQRGLGQASLRPDIDIYLHHVGSGLLEWLPTISLMDVVPPIKDCCGKISPFRPRRL